MLRRHESIPAELLKPLEELDPDERVPIDVLHELLRGAVALTGDEDLGLKAARELGFGNLDVFEYLGATARNLREAIAAINPYYRLIGDTYSLTIEPSDARSTVIRFESTVTMPRSSEDFGLAALFLGGRYRVPELRAHVHFRHDGPRSCEHETTFGDSELTFNAAFSGFVVPTEDLDRDLPARDAKLHGLISGCAERVLSSLPAVEVFPVRVRELLLEGLHCGGATSQTVASKLHMSPRTMARKLGAENTSFNQLLDELRRELALRHVTNLRLTLGEAAFLLGYSNPSAFNHAFVRWTGMAPSEYRRLHASTAETAQ